MEETALELGHWPPLISPGPEAGNKWRRPRARVAVHVRPQVLSISAHAHLKGEENTPLISLPEPLHGRVTLVQPAASSYVGTATTPITLSCLLLTHPGTPPSPVQEGPGRP